MPNVSLASSINQVSTACLTDTEAPKQHRNDVRLAPRQVFSVLYHQFRFQLFPATIG